LLQSCYAVAAKLLRMSGYLPDKSHQPTEQRKESRRESLPPLGKKLQSD
jgi:hypothetical protein